MKVFITTFTRVFSFLIAIFVFIIFLILLVTFTTKQNNSYFTYLSGDKKSNQKIAIMKITGPIISEPLDFYNFEILQSINAIYPSLMEKYLSEIEQKKIKGLIISIDSPGGSVSATKNIYEIIMQFKKKNDIPIYFHTNEILASGAYWLSLTGDKIYASYGSIIGSIGVKGPDWLFYNSPTSISNGIIGKSIESPYGIKKFSNTAGISKDIFNPFRSPTNKEYLQLQEMVDDIYNDFLTLASSSRKIEKEILQKEIGAMIFNAKQAKDNFLIDDQKNINEVIKELIEELEFDKDKIIINSNDKKYSFLNLNFLKILLLKKISNNYEVLINSRFCNNLLNGFSTVAISNYNKKC